MKISKETSEVLKSLFANHPDTDVLFITSDNAAFKEAHNADSYSQRLSDQTVTTVTRQTFEIGEALIQTDRAQEAPEGKVKGVDTIPTDVIDLSKEGSKDAALALTEEQKGLKDELSDTVKKTETKEIKTAEPVKTPEELEKEKASADKKALAPRYEELFKKKPAPQYNAVKMQELITAEETRIASESK